MEIFPPFSAKPIVESLHDTPSKYTNGKNGISVFSY